MHPSTIMFAQRLLAALLAGALIGTERSVHGRAAGFRTHALVAMASSVAMYLTVAEASWLAALASDATRMDPTRTAQGIMTGIGFLGAGVIFKEGPNVRGLTTAASIWTTAAVGILMGVGLYWEGALATVLTLGVLSMFRHIERLFPIQTYCEAVVCFRAEAPLAEAEVEALLRAQGFKVLRLAYHLEQRDRALEYRMAVRTTARDGPTRLAAALREHPAVRGFTLTPAGD
jgi:putative Mg2+ transporter-C (MgtC) family protein